DLGAGGYERSHAGATAQRRRRGCVPAQCQRLARTALCHGITRMNVTSASTEEAKAAAEAASAAFYSFGCSAPALRARLLRSIADGIERLGDVLITCAARETALAELRLVGERGRTCAQLRMFADIAEGNHWIDECVEAADP